MKVGINGFGRIGKAIFRILRDREIEVTRINDPFLTPDYIAYLLKYDSISGKNPNNVEFTNNSIFYKEKETVISNHKNPEDISWNVDCVIESSGVFKTIKECELHSAPKICITAPSTDAPMFVYGVNHTTYNNEKVFSNASCTTNCLAPLAHVIHNKFGIKEGLMTTVHAATATQKVVDAPSSKDWRSGRSTLNNIIPSSTGAASAVGKVIPGLLGKLTGMAFRVPVSNVSVVDFTFRTEKETDLSEIMDEIKRSSQNELKGVLGFTEERVVSSDFLGNPLSSIVDVDSCIALNNQFFKVISWYDNEYGYSARVVDLIQYTQNLKK